ncbi:hypothetical protein K8R03_02340 [Candidatus Kaiserbacteria bacterium]|nr:hypothetical protein [Candidatus Kaiserbacteria bacterium]
MNAATQLLNNFVKVIIDPAILIVFSLGFLAFMYGLVEFMWNLNSGEASNEGKKHMLWGIVGMLIMVSVFGIITIIDDTFGFGALNGNGSSTDVNRLNSVAPPCIFSGC